MAQIVYYVTAGLALGATERGRCRSPCRPATSATCWRAGSPGGWALPVEQLVIGSNRNDILTRFLDTGTMPIDVVVPTLSPSMDIQVSSNFERLLFEMNGRDGGLTAEQMAHFRQSGRLALESDQLGELRGSFAAARRRAGHGRDIAETYRRPACSSTRTPRSASRPPESRARSRRPDRRARHRPSGQVPRRRRAGDRGPPRAARPPRRPLRAPRALRGGAEQPRCGEGRDRQRGDRQRGDHE